jgi:hypothetical protein
MEYQVTLCNENGLIDALQICWRKTHFQIARPKGEKIDTYMNEWGWSVVMAGGFLKQKKYDLKSWKKIMICVMLNSFVSFIPTFC